MSFVSLTFMVPRAQRRAVATKQPSINLNLRTLHMKRVSPARQHFAVSTHAITNSSQPHLFYEHTLLTISTWLKHTGILTDLLLGIGDLGSISWRCRFLAQCSPHRVQKGQFSRAFVSGYATTHIISILSLGSQGSV